MNILVTGANGQLGRALQHATRHSQDRYLFTDLTEGYTQLDITDLAAIRRLVAQQEVGCIVNCAAWTDVDQAESHQEMAHALNAIAPQHLATAMRERDGLLVHISTDYVFGGDPCNTPCDESQRATPLGVYGSTKLLGEQMVQASGCRHLILRTAWLYSEHGKNFVKTMLRLTATKPALQVVFDQCGTPTYAGDLAQAIFHILEHRAFEGHNGLFHYSNEGACSWYDFAVRIAELAGHTGCDIQPCRSHEYPTVARRPAYTVLDKAKFKATFGLRIPHWAASLQTCVAHLMAHPTQY